jgi:outer membrane protein TolC
MKYFLTLTISVISVCCFGQGRTLEFFLQQAKQNSPSLKDLQNQILSAKIDSQLLAASLRPQVNFQSTNSYAPIIAGYGYDAAITNIAQVSGLIQVNRNFIARGNLSAQYRTIALQSRALLDTIQISQQDLVKTITEQYITAFSDQLTMDFNKEVYDLMKEEEQLLKKLTQASVYKQTDYLTFYTTMQQQELTYLQAQIQYTTDYLTLNYLSGVVDTTVSRIEEPHIADSLRYDLASSIFYKKFETDSLRLENEKRIIDYEYKPKIGAYTDGGFNSTLQNTPYKNFGFSVGLSLTIPIYDGGQKKLKYAKVDLRERTRQSNKDFFINQYRQQTTQLRLQLRAIEMLVPRINEQIGFVHTLITANGKLLETGDITMRDYVTAINNYLTAKNLLTQNNISRLRIANQINYWNR